MSPLPNIQTAQYGDRIALEKLGAVRRTMNPAADVNGMKDMVGGRPAETDPVKLAMRSIQSAARQPQQPQQVQLSPTELEHEREFNALGEMYRDTMRMIRVAQRPGAGRVTQNAAINMIRAYAREFMRVRGITPFFTTQDGTW